MLYCSSHSLGCLFSWSPLLSPSGILTLSTLRLLGYGALTFVLQLLNHKGNLDRALVRGVAEDCAIVTRVVICHSILHQPRDAPTHAFHSRQRTFRLAPGGCPGQHIDHAEYASERSFFA